jgi:hypothetical protein
MSHTQKSPPTGKSSAVVKANLSRLGASASCLWGAISKVAHLPATSLVLLIVLTIVDAALCLLAMYLIDLGISLMELWAELARKHLELTL